MKRAFLPALALRVTGGQVFPADRLCRRCWFWGAVAPADPASETPTCRGHLAEDRVNLIWGADRE